MDKRSAIWFLQHGATITHISWDENQTIHLFYGFVRTSTNRIFSPREFWRIYCDDFFVEGWELAHPFRSMAIRVLNDKSDEVQIRRMSADLQRDACIAICGMDSPSVAREHLRTRVWMGYDDYSILVGADGGVYMPGVIISDECVEELADKLAEFQIVPHYGFLQSCPYMHKMRI